MTDFLNAAYYRRPVADRDVDDLRLAFCVLTTYWYRKPGHRRLRMTDLPAFYRAVGGHRFATEDSTAATLNREQLLAGAARLLGDWFPTAYADARRRGWGIAFETTANRDAHDPACRMKLARPGRQTPERAPLGQQVWHTYPPVQMPSADAVIAALTAPETWPDYASEIGRFTPLRAGGLDGHEGHFMGAGHNRLLLHVDDGVAWVRAAGTWDPMPWHIEQAYRIAGREAQHAFWGQGNVVSPPAQDDR